MNNCEYCENERGRLCNQSTNEVYLSNKTIEAFCGWCGCHTTVRINYCPMCGRKLEEEQ